MSALKYALIFLAGAGVGAGVSAFFFKKKYVEVLKKSDEELKKMDEYYQNELDKAYKTTSDDTEDDISPETKERLRKVEKGIDELLKEQKKPEKRQGSFATDYTSYYHTEDPAESEHPREEEEPVKHESQPPKLIRAAMFGQDGYSTRVLYYYTEDDTLIPEGGTYDDIVDTDEVADSIGNALIKYGFADVNNLEREIFVRNFDRKCDYHIIKVVGSLSEDYGG
jgi:hypothetical protein